MASRGRKRPDRQLTIETDRIGRETALAPDVFCRSPIARWPGDFASAACPSVRTEIGHLPG
jgi:hypothetical protein